MEEFGFGSRRNRDSGQILSREMIQIDASGRHQGVESSKWLLLCDTLVGTKKIKQAQSVRASGNRYISIAAKITHHSGCLSEM